MNLKTTEASANDSSTEVLKNWDGFCREFGCSEEQMRELYHFAEIEELSELTGLMNFKVIREEEWCEGVSAGQPLN
jgi:hypothetical protein